MNPYWLICPACGHREFCRFPTVVQRLQSIGMLKRTANPDAELVRQLLLGAANRLQCRSCSQQGLGVEEAEDDDDEWDGESWNEVRACRQCGQPLPAERLQLYPDAHYCAQCAAQTPTATEYVEYCPRCGTPMQLKSGSRGGIARYEYRCPSCRQ